MNSTSGPNTTHAFTFALGGDIILVEGNILRGLATDIPMPVGCDLVALRLNPWWYPHDLYAPKDDGSGGPFTISRVIHSSRGVGFTGWIGGVAVFNRALNTKELLRLSDVGRGRPITLETTP